MHASSYRKYVIIEWQWQWRWRWQRATQWILGLHTHTLALARSTHAIRLISFSNFFSSWKRFWQFLPMEIARAGHVKGNFRLIQFVSSVSLGFTQYIRCDDGTVCCRFIVGIAYTHTHTAPTHSQIVSGLARLIYLFYKNNEWRLMDDSITSLHLCVNANDFSFFSISFLVFSFFFIDA